MLVVCFVDTSIWFVKVFFNTKYLFTVGFVLMSNTTDLTFPKFMLFSCLPVDS